MVASGPTGPGIPVVHIRVVCEKEPKGFSCDFCFRSFPSEESMYQHVSSDHTSFDILDVYVCSVCDCCVFSRNDLLEHTANRHEIHLSGIGEDCNMCEYCGIQVSNMDVLCKHMEKDHIDKFLERGISFHNITELTLGDISKMGAGSDKVRTIFKVLEIPYKVSPLPNDLDDKSDECSYQKIREETGMQNDKHIKPDDMEKNIKSSTEGDVSSEYSKPEFGIDIVVASPNKTAGIDQQELDSSEMEMMIQCEPKELSSAEGELILTIESEEKVVWNKDVMSKVFNSTNILREAKEGENSSNAVFEKINEESVGPEETLAAMPLKVSEPAELVLEYYSDNEDNQLTTSKEPSNSVEADIPGTRVIINKVDGSITSLHFNGEENYMSQRKKRKSCCICAQTFNNLETLERHEGTTHGVRIKCILCDSTFAFSKSLRTHYLRKHVDAKMFTCEMCEKSFKSRSNLWSHQLIHDESTRKVKCPQCPQRFHSKSKLNCHLQSHSGRKKYQCGECNKGFYYPGGLMKHMNKHLSESNMGLPDNDGFYLVEVETEEMDDVNATSTQQPCH